MYLEMHPMAEIKDDLFQCMVKLNNLLEIYPPDSPEARFIEDLMVLIEGGYDLVSQLKVTYK